MRLEKNGSCTWLTFAPPCAAPRHAAPIPAALHGLHTHTRAHTHTNTAPVACATPFSNVLAQAVQRARTVSWSNRTVAKVTLVNGSNMARSCSSVKV